tara:strand:- start:741 stop:1226 length:486 start_codon:yes stop_codon:yes gene_type:complete
VKRHKYILFPLFFFFVCKAIADDLNEGFLKLSENKPEEAIQLWSPLAEAGDKVAQASLGLLFQTGQGTKVDFIRALELFRASAKQGYPFAFTALGNSYHEGLGVKEDRRTALIWFLLGAEHDPNSAFMAQALMTEIPEKEVQLLIQKALACQKSKYLKCNF